jgi:hypothetical protein
MGNAAGIVPVGLVAQARQGRLHLPGFHDDNSKAFGPQASRQPWRQVAGFQPHAVNMFGKASYRVCNIIDLGSNLTFQANLALFVDDAERRDPEANVQTCRVSHHNLSLVLRGHRDHSYIRELASDSEQARLRMLLGFRNRAPNVVNGVGSCQPETRPK